MRINQVAVVFFAKAQLDRNCRCSLSFFKLIKRSKSIPIMLDNTLNLHSLF